jgi:hypothetical protein
MLIQGRYISIWTWVVESGIWEEKVKAHPAPEHSTVRGSPESVLRTGSGKKAKNTIQINGVAFHLLSIAHPKRNYSLGRWLRGRT